MALISTGKFLLPRNTASGILDQSGADRDGSVLAKLSPQQPMLFGETDVMTFTARPRAEFVGEGAAKSASDASFGSKTVKPHKAQVTIRATEEVLWADQDHQLRVISQITDAMRNAMYRALDLGAIHQINPLTGTPASGLGEYANQTTLRTEAAGKADLEIEAAVGLLMGAGYQPSGIALDPRYAFTVATTRNQQGNRVFPELGFGGNVTNVYGLDAAVSSTVSGVPEVADTKLRALVGDFTQFYWGMQRDIWAETIEYGDPDNTGVDLKGNNQVAFRVECVFGWAWMDVQAMAAIEDAVA